MTVSRALSSPDRVSEHLRRNVERAIRELNYIPNLSARSLASARSDVVGVLVPSLSHTVFADVLRGIYDGIGSGALHIQIGNTRYDPHEEERLIGGFLRQKPAAMIVAGVDQTENGRRMLREAGCPVVQIMDLTDDPIDRIVGFSHVEAGRRMTEHLIAAGYRRIAFLSAWLSQRSEGRLIGYRQALAAAGLEEPCRSHSLPADEVLAFAEAEDPSSSGLVEYSRPRLGRAIMSRALEMAPDIDAVFCNSDTLAIGALAECLARGLRVPQDIGIAGFNDLDFAEVTSPALSTVRTHRYQIGRAAVETLRLAFAGEDQGPRVLDMGVEIVGRASTARA